VEQANARNHLVRVLNIVAAKMVVIRVVRSFAVGKREPKLKTPLSSFFLCFALPPMPFWGAHHISGFMYLIVQAIKGVYR
jgi:hypothetical protein